MTTLKDNFHTHTWRCLHAEGDVADYCRAAVEAGLTILGMSDHTPLPDGRWPEVRMRMDQLPEYLAAIHLARAEFPSLALLKALECEYVPEFIPFYEDELLGRLGLDYLITGTHALSVGGQWLEYGRIDTPAALRAYAECLGEAMRSGLFAFVAHPDLFGCNYPVWDADAEACARDILAASVETGVPLEINGYGMRKPEIDTPEGRRRMYPWEPFWRVAAEYDIRVVINSDAHRPQDVAAGLDEGLALAQRFGLQPADLSHLGKQRVV